MRVLSDRKISSIRRFVEIFIDKVGYEIKSVPEGFDGKFKDPEGPSTTENR